LEETLRNWTCIRVAGSSDSALAKLQKTAVDTRTVAAKGKLNSAIAHTRNQAIGYFQDFFLLAIGVYFILYQDMQLSQFVAFYIAASKLKANMPAIAVCLSTLNQAQGALTSLLSINAVRPNTR
jgi:ABC-type bacteriocin/lantibiotic exporter with double-glycine peptidase domain